MNCWSSRLCENEVTPTFLFTLTDVDLIRYSLFLPFPSFLHLSLVHLVSKSSLLRLSSLAAASIASNSRFLINLESNMSQLSTIPNHSTPRTNQTYTLTFSNHDVPHPSSSTSSSTSTSQQNWQFTDPLPPTILDSSHSFLPISHLNCSLDRAPMDRKGKKRNPKLGSEESPSPFQRLSTLLGSDSQPIKILFQSILEQAKTRNKASKRKKKRKNRHTRMDWQGSLDSESEVWGGRKKRNGRNKSGKREGWSRRKRRGRILKISP